MFLKAKTSPSSQIQGTKMDASTTVPLPALVRTAERVFKPVKIQALSEDTAESHLFPLSGDTHNWGVAKDVERALSTAKFPLKGIHCSCRGRTLTLSGFATRYHTAQIAIEIARRFAKGVKIDCQIKIIRPAGV